MQDGLVVGGAGLALGIEALEHFGEVGGVEESLGDEVLFLEEPAEDETGEEADEAGGVALLLVGFQIGREFDLRERPKIPVGEFFVEPLVEQLDVEDFLPRCMQGVKIVDGLLLRMNKVAEDE